MEQKSNDIDSAITAVMLAMKPYDSMTADKALQIASIKIRHEFENERREGMLGIAAMFQQGAEFIGEIPLHDPTDSRNFNRAGVLTPEEIQNLHKDDTQK